MEVACSHSISSIIEGHEESTGIPKETKEGKLDFHGLRVSFVTLAVEAGANIREAQTLARHSTPELTANVCVKTRDVRLAELAESIGEKGPLRARACHIYAPQARRGQGGFA